MPGVKISKAIKLNCDGMKIEIVETVDLSPEAEACSQRVQELVEKMIVLGNKKGRPKKDDESYDDAA